MVVKGSSTVVQELFAARVAKAVGVAVPEMRMTAYTQPEWRRLQQRLKAIAKSHHKYGCGIGWLVGWIYLKSYNKQAYLPPYMKTTSGSETF